MRTFRLALLLPVAAFTSVAGQARWTGTVDLTIGGPSETREAYMLNLPSGLLIDGAGRIVVAQPGDNAVRVYSAKGSHLYTFGRAGQGPGDLGMPCCLAMDATGRLWIRELRNSRHSIFALDDARATFVTSYPVRGGSGPWDRLNWDPKGAILYITTESRGGPIRTVRFHADSAGQEVSRDTLRDPPLDSASRVFITRVIPGGRSVYSTVVDFAPQFLRAEGPGGVLAETHPERYEIEWLGPDLKTIRTITGKYDPPALSSKEKALAREHIADFAKKMQADVDLDAVKIPARKPVIEYLGFDLDGRLWVGLSTAEGQPRTADVYDQRGRLIARATWPGDVTLRFSTIRGMTGLGIRMDPDSDLPSVVRVRLTAR
jgi:hypothetical protein